MAFTYSPSKFIAFRDEQACARVRAIPRAKITKHKNPKFRIEVIDDKIQFYSRFALDIVDRIRRAGEAGRSCVLILPVGPVPQYRIATDLINRLKISYEFIPSIDESFIYQQSWGLSTAEFDNSLFALETEIFKPGLIRTSVGYFIQRYYNSSKTVNGIQFRAFLFQ